ncbi:uncharacterized protein TNCV_994451 [Trichonephila clavipes]|nr:uncharacterized protein TNCV_994451 [Trichonephila clavipes]
MYGMPWDEKEPLHPYYLICKNYSPDFKICEKVLYRVEDWFEEDDYVKFEETGNLGVLPGRGRKLVEPKTVEEVATTIFERASSPTYSSASGLSASREMEIPWSTVRKILRYILKWYTYKIHVMQTLKPQDRKTRLGFACRFLARMEVDDMRGLGKFYGQMRHTFISMEL